MIRHTGKIVSIYMFILLISSGNTPVIAQESQQSEFTYFKDIPYVAYRKDTEKVTIILDYQPGWGYRVMNYSFPDRIALEVAFKPGTPDEYKKDVSDYKEFTRSFLLRDIRASIDKEGLRVTVSSNFSKFPFEYELDDRRDERRLYVHVPLRYASVKKESVSDGVEYHEITMVDDAGPRKMHIVYTEVASGRYRPDIVTARDMGSSFLRVDRMAQNTSALCAVNGGFFSGDGTNQGLIIKNRRLVSYPKFNRPVFARTSDGKLHIGYLPLRGILNGPGGIRFHFDSIDARPSAGQVVLLTPGHPSRISSPMRGSHIVIKDKVVEMVTTEPVEDKRGRYILWSADYRDDFKRLKAADPVEIEFYLGVGGLEIESAIGAGPILVVDGMVDIRNENDFQRDIMVGRAPRTGIGLTRDGILMLAVLEGRNPLVSIGGTIEEFATLMRNYGAVQALNLDGGGSSSMVISGEQVSSSIGGGRAVTSAIVVTDNQMRFGIF